MTKLRPFLQPLLLVAAPFLLAFGLILPLVRFERFYFFDDTPSLLEIVASLWHGGDLLLAGIVGLVSIVLPGFKIVFLAYEAVAGGTRYRIVNRYIVPVLSKWSMMDVLIVALAIVAAKTSGLADAFTQPGLWFYAASSISSGLLHALARGEGGRYS